jgi:hypothetical protein
MCTQTIFGGMRQAALMVVRSNVAKDSRHFGNDSLSLGEQLTLSAWHPFQNFSTPVF